MNDDIYTNWEIEIDTMEISEDKKDSLKKYVSNILLQNGVVIINISHLSHLLGIKDEILRRMINASDFFYREFSIKKRDGRQRYISAPYPSLMKVQRWIYDNVLLPTTNFQESAKGFIPKLSIVDNALPHVEHREVLKMDIKDFFPSINIERIISIFKHLGYYHKLSYSLASLCCKGGALPQGAPTSPILSNIVLRHLDNRILGLSKHFNITYTRYADDLTFSGDYIPVKFIDYIQSIIEDEGFNINKNKTRLLRGNTRKIITGVSISSGKATIPKYLKRQIRQEAYYIHKYGIKQHIKHCHINDVIYKQRLVGKFAYWKSVERYNEKIEEMLYQLKNDFKKKNMWRLW